MCNKRFLAILLCLVGFISISISQSVEYVFQDPSESIDKRVEDLISKMTLEEKASQLMFASPPIERLNIPKYNWWNECLHGVARNGKATVFPQAIGMGATFDTNLMHKIGVAISDEARAKFNENRRIGYMDRYAGLTFWSPNVNLFRDPRWGRGQETYGEDPFHIAKMGVSFVKGLQGDGEILKTAAMAKHYAVHSGPEKLRHEFDAVVSDYDLWNTYLPAFEALVVDADVEGVMGAYNRTNGEPCCAHSYLMGDVLRDKWGFDGYFVSDCWALVDLYNGHKLVPDQKAAAAMALNEGCNLNCGNTYPALLESIEAGLTTEEQIDANLRQLLPTRFKLGILDPVGSNKFDNIPLDVVRSQSHLDLSYEAASKSIVLLKNKDNVLPLDPEMHNLFVTGPMAAHAQALLANYYGISSDLKTLLEGIADNVSDHTAIRYVQGNLMDRPNVNPVDWFSEESEVAEVTIACMGISQLLEGEEGEAIASPFAGDREYITLPPHQVDFLKLLRSKAEKLVVVITGGSAISIPEVHEMADAVVYAWYPGEQGGQAVGDILFGKKSPSGKLPVTFVNSIDDLAPFEDYNMQGRTYRYMEKAPLYPFGYGLSYSEFKFSDFVMSSDKLKNGQVNVSVNVSNTGAVDADEVVQLYITKLNRGVEDPISSLKAFERISLNSGESKTVRFTLSEDAFSEYDKNGDLQLEKGNYNIIVGSSAPIKRSLELGAAEWVVGKIRI